MAISYGYNNINTLADWNNTLFITGLIASTAVNTLVTGMIVFRILKVTRINPIISVERTLVDSSTRGTTKFRHVMFIIIESGMVLFSIQLVRIVLLVTRVPAGDSEAFSNWVAAYDIVTAINQMLNVIIIRSVHF